MEHLHQQGITKVTLAYTLAAAIAHTHACTHITASGIFIPHNKSSHLQQIQYMEIHLALIAARMQQFECLKA